MAQPFGYWTFNGKNGLAGLEGTFIEDHGRLVYQPHPTNPAVLDVDFISNALRTSRVARAQYNILYPRLLPEEQQRLDDMFAARPFLRKLMPSPMAEADAIQRKDVQGSVRLAGGSTTGSARTTSTTGSVSVGDFSPSGGEDVSS